MSALALPERLTIADARATLQQLQRAVAAESSVVVDASALATLDSAALAVLLQCRRDAQAAGKPFVLQSPPDKLVALARMYGVSELLAL